METKFREVDRVMNKKIDRKLDKTTFHTSIEEVHDW